MKKLLPLFIFLFISQLIFAQNAQTGQNLLQGMWRDVDSSTGINRNNNSFFEFKNSGVNIFWFGDSQGAMAYHPFTYENNRLIITVNGRIFINATCILIGNEMILLFNEGWIIFNKD